MMNEKAREGFLLSMTPQATSSKGDGRLKFTGKVSTRASSILSNNERKILPQYLRASTGSCHDFCKYGTKHMFDSKGKHPSVHRFSGSSGTPVKEQNRVKVLNVSDRQRKTSKQKALAFQKAELNAERAFSPVKVVDHSEIQIIHQNSLFPEKTSSSETIKCNCVSPSEKIVSLEGFETVTKGTPSKRIGSNDDHEVAPSIHTESAFSPVEVIDDSEIQIINQNFLFPEKTGSSESSEIIECNFLSPSEKIVSLEGFEIITKGTPRERIGLNDDHEIITQKSTPLLEKTEESNHSETAKKKKPAVKKFHSSLAPASVERRIHSTKRVVASIKPVVKKKDFLVPARTVISPVLPGISRKEVSLSKRPDAAVHPALSGKSKRTTLGSASIQNLTMGTSSRKNENKGPKNLGLSTYLPKKNFRPQSTPLSPQPPLKQISNFAKSATPVRDTRKVGKSPLDFDKIKEKTLYVIEPTPTQDSKGEENQDIECALVEPCSISEHGGTKANNAGKKSQRRMVTAHPEDGDPTLYKVQFRRGKIMSPQSDNNGARRLRFRQAKKVDDEHSVNKGVEKRSFRRRQPVGGNLNHPGSEAQAVVLRHQDLQDKKDAPDLFNQIIEETASKLVKTRKSKVKALVGAFETVISLQESKPAASV